MFWGKVALFLGGKLGKFLIVIAALTALAGAAYAGVSAVRNWQKQSYESGVEAGRSEIQLAWEKANNKALDARIEQIRKDVERSSSSVDSYLIKLEREGALLAKTKERTVVYANSASGVDRCLDVDGVQLIEAARSNLGFPSSAETETPDKVSRVVSVAGSPQD